MIPVSVLMTCYNREPEIILSVFRSLQRSAAGLAEIELVFVNDGSDLDYEFAHSLAKERFKTVKWHSAPPYEAYRIGGGFNVPCRAFNEGMRLVTNDRVIVMSSDVLATPKAFKMALSFDWSEIAYHPSVMDLETCQMYVGPQRIFPAPWMLCLHRPHIIAARGWDEEYLKGMCYDDNDFMGRVLGVTGKFIVDYNSFVYHVSHAQVAYDFSNPEIREANLRNRAYTKEKWGGIPFDAEMTPIDIIREPHPIGQFAYKMIDRGDAIKNAIEKTADPFVAHEWFNEANT